MDMTFHRRSRMQGNGRSRMSGATIAGLVTLTCLIAVPPELVELGFASTGLSELLPVLAPPIGWPVRIVLALSGAALAAVLGAGQGGNVQPLTMKGGRPGMKGIGIMGWAQSLGLHHLARIARGESEGRDTAPMAPSARTLKMVPSHDALPRSRKDRHPDAPPRAPLVASRDLPPVPAFSSEAEPAAPQLTLVESPGDAVPPVTPMPRLSPVRDTTGKVRARPLPRSPQPLSDSDLGWVRDLLVREDRVEQPVEPAVIAPVRQDAPASPAAAKAFLADIAAVETDPSIPLLSLVDRFEQGVAHRAALRDAADAQARAGEGLTGHAGPSIPVEPAQDGDPALHGAREVDQALSAALETLRKLSVKANGR